MTHQTEILQELRELRKLGVDTGEAIAFASTSDGKAQIDDMMNGGMSVCDCADMMRDLCFPLSPAEEGERAAREDNATFEAERTKAINELRDTPRPLSYWKEN